MATPPAAGRRWYSIRSSVTSASGVMPSKVAALITRLRRVSGPSRAGSNTSTGGLRRSYGGQSLEGRVWGAEAGGQSRGSEAFDDGDVGLASALAHGLEPVAAAGALQLVQQGRHEAGAGRAEGVAEGDRAAVRVGLRGVGTGLLQ